MLTRFHPDGQHHAVPPTQLIRLFRARADEHHADTIHIALRLSYLRLTVLKSSRTYALT